MLDCHQKHLSLQASKDSRSVCKLATVITYQRRAGGDVVVGGGVAAGDGLAHCRFVVHADFRGVTDGCTFDFVTVQKIKSGGDVVCTMCTS